MTQFDHGSRLHSAMFFYRFGFILSIEVTVILLKNVDESDASTD
jgi:hypothetical protein